jgi:branched-chain amino acid aminotransferase
LYVCDELFFTGTAVGLAPVVRVDHRQVGHGVTGPITAELRRTYFAAMRGEMQAYRKWLEPVYQSQTTPEREAMSLIGA